ncbi:hypothetical protein [Streptomyces sp. CBMA156]|uniref:hypothetical protein n=1 Tax=Streptomyces sp. CBMA156 TaxID=1930280 RepID=UPI001661A11E|nr:hypothetical protein [Streptomyces sp. CBMA156]MBD0672305.1 hypothetical protein [Streptomyces sp. CBMA156]
MSRFRAAAAVTALGAFLLLGAGAATAHADDGAGSGAPDRSNGSTVNDSGSGNIIGNVHGNVVNTQQTATGSGAGAGNQDNGLAVTGNTGSVEAHQNNGNGGGS